MYGTETCLQPYGAIIELDVEDGFTQTGFISTLSSPRIIKDDTCVGPHQLEVTVFRRRVGLSILCEERFGFRPDKL